MWNDGREMGVLARRRQLSETQRSLLKRLAASPNEPLSVRDLQRLVGASSPSVVHHHLRMLERNGYLKHNPADPHRYLVVGEEPEQPVWRLPVFGLVQCGPKGSLLDTDPIDEMALSSRMIPGPVEEYYLVKARGDSMEPRIHDGDLVLTRKANVAENGSLVVCVNRGAGMIKQFKREAKERYILSSLNATPQNEPFLADRDFRIVGVVVGVISYQVPSS